MIFQSLVPPPTAALGANSPVSLRGLLVRPTFRINQARPYSDAPTPTAQRKPRLSPAAGAKVETRNGESQKEKPIRKKSSCANIARDDSKDVPRSGPQPRSGSGAGHEGRAMTIDQRSRGGQKDYEWPQWQIQKSALTKKFDNAAWNPRKRLSPDALEGIRELHRQYPNKYTTPILAEQFEVSPEAIRRILKSKWRPSEEEEFDRRRRWDKRGESIWARWVNMGLKPPKKWREMGIREAVGGPTSDVDRMATLYTHEGSLDHDGRQQHWVKESHSQSVLHVPISERLL